LPRKRESTVASAPHVQPEAIYRITYHTLDDFGSGYSSLNYVKELPVDGLKIDKSFIDGLGEGAVNDAIVRLIVDFAHTLGLKVTA
jgi:sensor c-di-GMP phosphodiesterase-like protein